MRVFLFLALALCNSAFASGHRTLIFAVDGFSYESFEVARKGGLFRAFNSSSRHVATYPSMSEPSWTELLGGKQVFGSRGNVGTIEAAYFDFEDRKAKDDPRLYFNRIASPYSFMRAFDYAFNPFIETLMYFPDEPIVDLELEQIESSIEAGFKGDFYIAYVSSSDAIAHTQKNALYPFLGKLDRMISRVMAKYPGNVDFWLVSDHGNIGAFREGSPESYLKDVSFDAAASRAGLKIIAPGEEVRQPRDIAIPVLALSNVATVYFKDLTKREALAREILKEPSVELLTWYSASDRAIRVLSPGGEAEVRWSGDKFAYLTLRGNPLGLPAEVCSSAGAPRFLDDATLFKATLNSPYPDSVRRLVAQARGQVRNVPDLMVNLKAGYHVRGPMSAFVRMVRTHGSLSGGSSLGLLAQASASGARGLPGYIRSENVLATIGLSPRAVFHESKDFFPGAKPPAVAGPALIHTRIGDLSPDLLFRRANKILASTLEVIDPTEARELGHSFKRVLAARSGSRQGGMRDVTNALKIFDLKKVFENLGGLISVLKDPELPTLPPEKMARQLEQSILANPGLEPLGRAARKAALGPSDPTVTQASLVLLRRGVMKLWDAPYLINEWLDLPERETVSDTRNSVAAGNWFSAGKARLREHPEALLTANSPAPKLFKEIFEERKLKEKLSPASFPLFYNAQLPPVTVVYVPGLYNELFDHEIFARGLRSLREELGLRVITVETDGRCSTARNAKVVLERLKEDTAERAARGLSRPHYLFLGYSKGGPEAVEALLLDPEFARSQVLGVVTIASPNQGSSIVERADLPGFVTKNSTLKPLPDECRAPGSATGSLSPQARGNFWAAHLKELAGLTRYYSVTFKSELSKAHPWMKITKVVGQFKTDNDGVVTVEASKFPEALTAVDLGTFEADHLAGIIASDFRQGPFMTSLLLTLNEIGAFDPTSARAWREVEGRRSPVLMPAFHRASLSRSLLQASDSSGASPVDVTGPLPPSNSGSDDDFVWWSAAAKTPGVEHTPLICRGLPELRRFTKALGEKTRGTEYALKPFSLRCEGSQLVVNVESSGSGVEFGSYYLPSWKNARHAEKTVATLGELAKFLLTEGLASGKNLGEAKTPASMIPPSNRAPEKLASNTQGWNADLAIDLKKLPDMMKAVSVSPTQGGGVRIVCDHSSMQAFRKEYEFSYETTSPGGVDDRSDGFGYSPTVDSSATPPLTACLMKSSNNSIRMTTMAYRFKPVDFPALKLKIKVNQGVPGADSALGGSGKDDSAFQVWFSFRQLKPGTDRTLVKPDEEVRIFGYYWADPNSSGKMPAPGALLQNYYSRKNFVVATLPEAWQIALSGGKANEKVWKEFSRNLADDMAKAFPGLDRDAMEIVAITIQTDSNDVAGSSEALFRHLLIEPK